MLVLGAGTAGCGEVNQSFADAAATGDSAVTDAGDGVDARPACNARVLYASGPQRTSSLYTARHDGSDVRPVTSDALGDGEAQWSPDGASILFTSARNGSRHLYSMSPSGSEVRQLTFGSTRESLPSWSPDGRKIAYLVEARLWVASSDGTLAAPLDAPPVPLFGAFRWSPDGRNIALASGTPGDLFMVPVDGRPSVNITNTSEVDERQVAWSPDGTRIAFARANAEGWNDLWVASADGSGPVNLTPNTDGGHDSWPLWIANDRIVFSSARDGGGQKLFAVAASGGLPVRVSDHRIPANGDDGDLVMGLSPDRSRVVFSRLTEASAKTAVGVVGVDGTEQTTFGEQATNPSWSPCSPVGS